MKYEINLKRITTHTATIEVDAEDEDSAGEAAKAKTEKPRSGREIDWELDNEEFEVDDIIEVADDEET
jgi:hypothetical protein